MKIGVVDFAADHGGALTILKDFHKYVCMSEEAKTHQWIFFTSIIDLEETENIKLCKNKNIKKGKLNRIYWEYIEFPMMAKKQKLDAIISLQNKALPVKSICQITYFHNLFLLQKPKCYQSYSGKLKIRLFLLQKLTLYSLNKSKLVIVQAAFIKKLLLEKKNNLKIKIVEPDVHCKKINVKPNEKYLGWFYPAEAVKGYRQQHLIIKAVKYLEENNIDIDFEILLTFCADESPYARKVYEEGKKYKQIKFIGKQDRDTILELYTKYGLIITSEFESCPLPIKEAIYYNSPILGFDYEYAKEAVGNYERCHLCEVDQYKELAMKMLDIKKYRSLGYVREQKLHECNWHYILEELDYVSS